MAELILQSLPSQSARQICPTWQIGVTEVGWRRQGGKIVVSGRGFATVVGAAWNSLSPFIESQGWGNLNTDLRLLLHS